MQLPSTRIHHLMPESTVSLNQSPQSPTPAHRNHRLQILGNPQTTGSVVVEFILPDKGRPERQTRIPGRHYDDRPTPATPSPRSRLRAQPRARTEQGNRGRRLQRTVGCRRVRGKVCALFGLAGEIATNAAVARVQKRRGRSDAAASLRMPRHRRQQGIPARRVRNTRAPRPSRTRGAVHFGSRPRARYCQTLVATVKSEKCNY